MRIRCVALVLCASFILSACGGSEASKEAMTNANLQIIGEDYIKLKLKDAGSAEFRGQFIGKAGAPCGEVNAKNGFGAYMGFQRYIVVGKELAVLESDMAPGEFDTSWSQICK